MRNELAKVYIKKKYSKGISFPTSISLNELCGHFSPTSESDDTEAYKVISQGDVVKIDLGVHIHGFAAVSAHTVVAGEEKVTGKKADVILAAYLALNAGVRLLNAKKNNNNEVTEAVSKVAASYQVNPVEGVLSHKMRRDIVDGFETIINKQTFDQKVEQRNFEHGDVFGLDVIVSTGEGKPKESLIKTTVFKRAVETTYKLKTDSGRKMLSVVEHNFYNFPFSMNAFDDEENIRLTKSIENIKTVARVGLTECVGHELFHPYPVLTEKKGDIVAHFKWTVAVRNEGPFIISGQRLDLSSFNSEFKIEDESLNKLLETPLDTFLPNSKKDTKVEKKKDNKAKKEAKRKAKERREQEKKEKKDEK